MTPGRLGVIFYFKPINSLCYKYDMIFCVREILMTKLLSREQVNQYHNSGFVSPVDVLNQDEIKQSIKEIENFEKRNRATNRFSA